jgi:uncharacterized membrane protein YeaQ/YmgE (transglycosylase-associated protein family)
MVAHGILFWLIIGGLAGWLAGMFVRGGGFGIIGDIVVGIIGAVVGGYIAAALGLVFYGILGTLLVATLGAAILIVILRMVRPV